jgi:large subunit ribosomal protein L15
MSLLSNLKPQKGSKKKMKRIGRGDASGHGGTSTKGHKGQLARSSAHVPRGFEGGQMPLHRRSPKWGFTNRFKKIYNVLNLDDLSENFSDGEEVSVETCVQKGLIRRSRLPLKILGRGKLSKKLKITAHAASESAKKGIEAGKGNLSLLKQAAVSE